MPHRGSVGLSQKMGRQRTSIVQQIHEEEEEESPTDRVEGNAESSSKVPEPPGLAPVAEINTVITTSDLPANAGVSHPPLPRQSFLR